MRGSSAGVTAVLAGVGGCTKLGAATATAACPGRCVIEYTNDFDTGVAGKSSDSIIATPIVLAGAIGRYVRPGNVETDPAHTGSFNIGQS
jgi:hypothetical protein